MTCQYCGRHTTTHGRLCRDCRREQYHDNQTTSHDIALYECAVCGCESSTKVCLECREDHQ